MASIQSNKGKEWHPVWMAQLFDGFIALVAGVHRHNNHNFYLLNTTSQYRNSSGSLINGNLKM